MGLIYNILAAIAHLAFVITDVFLLMLIIKVLYSRWRPSWLEQPAKTIEPIMKVVTTYANDVAIKFTGKTYSEKVLLLLIIICLSLVRLIVINLL